MEKRCQRTFAGSLMVNAPSLAPHLSLILHHLPLLQLVFLLRILQLFSKLCLFLSLGLCYLGTEPGDRLSGGGSQGKLSEGTQRQGRQGLSQSFGPQREPSSCLIGATQASL